MDAQRVTAKGEVSNLIVLADSTIWNSDVKDSLSALFSGPYIILPQPEPEYDLVATTYDSFSSTLKECSNILIIGTSSNQSNTFKNLQQELGVNFVEGETLLKQYRDTWADNQKVHVFFAEDIRQAWTENKDKLSTLVDQQDQSIIKQELDMLGRNTSIEQILQERFEIEVNIPAAYKISPVSNDSAIWVRDEQTDYGLNLIFYRTSIESPSKSSLIEYRDKLTSEYLESAVAGAYMRVDDEIIPAFYESGVLRGLWKLENDFMGGPFVTYYFPDSNVLVDGFVYAPNVSKRDYMKRIESVIRTIK